jgi:hypothetical protein
MKDECLLNINKLMEFVLLENIKQIQKWGVQDEPLPNWIMWLTEEIGELAQAAGDHYHRAKDPKRIFEEAIQAATLCLKIAEVYRPL